MFSEVVNFIINYWSDIMGVLIILSFAAKAVRVNACLKELDSLVRTFSKVNENGELKGTEEEVALGRSVYPVLKKFSVLIKDLRKLNSGVTPMKTAL